MLNRRRYSAWKTDRQSIGGEATRSIFVLGNVIPEMDFIFIKHKISIRNHMSIWQK